MLKNYIKIPSLTLRGKFDEFLAALNKGRFSIRKDFSLIFLCGANQSELIPSARRSFIKHAIELHMPHTRIVYAEKVMEELAKHGLTKNLLDIEHKILSIADWVLIVLESYSSFCELGAFADKISRKKLIVINDDNFRSQKSFINMGPLQAIAEDVSAEHVLWYPMNPDGIFNVDAIGQTLPGLLNIISGRKIRPKLKKENFLPNNINQDALFFLHDIIYLCGPITHSEMIMIYKEIFGKNSFDEVKELRGVLHASGILDVKDVEGNHSYMSKKSETFIDFGSSANDLMTVFRRYHMKFNPQRIFS
jgi:hypothetical protein